MPLNHTARTILEKTALDNGFSINTTPAAASLRAPLPNSTDTGFSDNTATETHWLIYDSPAIPASLCLTATPDNSYAIGTNHQGAAAELNKNLHPFPHPPPNFHAWHAPESRDLDQIAATIHRLAHSLPHEPLHQFQRRIAETPAPDTTEIKRRQTQRIGQDTFRNALLLFWNNQCAVTSITNPRLLRASHIIPWAQCDSDAERLNTYNGLLLAAHLDAAFDAHLISFHPQTAQITFSPNLTPADATALGLTPQMHLRQLHPETATRLAIHHTQTLNPPPS